MTSILSFKGVVTARHYQARTATIWQANHFLTNQLNMCAGGTVPLSVLKFAAAESTDMNLKMCADRGQAK